MNPFLHDPVARPAPLRTFTACIESLPRPARRHALRRAAGRIALAGTLGLAMLGSAGAAPVNVNTASAEQLETLRGVGPGTARLIIQERIRGGPFESLEDLSDRVRGIGPKRAQALQAAGLVVDKGLPEGKPEGRKAGPGK